MKQKMFFIGILYLIFLLSPLIQAEEMTFSGGGDGESWSQEDNWFPVDIPVLSSDLLIDLEDIEVICKKTFRAKSITLGGRESSTLTSNNFIYGTIDPGESTGVAILNRTKGTIVLKGAGTLILKGKYKDSEESPTPEPSFLFWIK